MWATSARLSRLRNRRAVSLRWFQRYTAAQRQMRQEQQLLDLARQVRQTRGQMDAFDQILGAAMACTGARHSFIAASQQGRANILARRGYSQAEALLLQQIPPSLDRGLTGQAYRTRAPARSDDIQLDPAALPALADTRSQLIIPICAEDRVLGLIDLQSPLVAAFQSADEPWMIALGDIAAGVLDQRGTREDPENLAMPMLHRSTSCCSHRGWRLSTIWRPALPTRSITR